MCLWFFASCLPATATVQPQYRTLDMHLHQCTSACPFSIKLVVVASSRHAPNTPTKWKLSCACSSSCWRNKQFQISIPNFIIVAILGDRCYWKLPWLLYRFAVQNRSAVKAPKRTNASPSLTSFAKSKLITPFYESITIEFVRVESAFIQLIIPLQRMLWSHNYSNAFKTRMQ